jgi:tRNA-dihydrouridine synthase 3
VELNVISSELKMQLRKHTYPFKTENRKKWEAMQANGGKRPRAPVPADSSGSSKVAKAAAAQQDVGAAAAAVSAAAQDVAEASASDRVASATTRERRLIDFSKKIYVAPLTTVGNLPWRRIMVDYGADVTVGEMALTHQLLKGSANEWALVKRHPCEKVFGLQVAGSQPEVMGQFAELVENELQVDFVDINMGCPIDLVCRKGMGSTLMGKQTKVRQIIQAMTSCMSTPLTLKMRIGIDDKKPIAHKLVTLARESGVIAAVGIHGRSKEQRYTRAANWDYIRSAAAAASDDYGTDCSMRPMPIIGNGDVMSWQDWEAGLETGVATNMLARGALIKPWLQTEIKERRDWDISSVERLDILKSFVRYGLEHWGSDDQGVARTRRFLLEWLSFTWRYVPVGLLEHLPQRINDRPPVFVGRNDLETLMASTEAEDWVKLSEILLGKVPAGFRFLPKHKANSYSVGGTMVTTDTLNDLDASLVSDIVAGTHFGKQLASADYRVLQDVMAAPNMPIVGSYDDAVTTSAAAPFV